MKRFSCVVAMSLAVFALGIHAAEARVLLAHAPLPQQQSSDIAVPATTGDGLPGLGTAGTAVPQRQPLATEGLQLMPHVRLMPLPSQSDFFLRRQPGDLG
ncbi:MAG TPA: hypothetical protein VFB20_15170 [Burkholderiales bacterium]|nr:hypothetical protein [Burkholderiales bacterium]